MNEIRILLIDDHSLFRSGLRSIMQIHDEFKIVGEAENGLEGIKRAKQLKPDLVLLDLHMPGMNGLEVLRILTEDMPEVQVLMLTVSEDAEDLLQALQNGARGYLLKNIDIDFLLDAIKRAMRGESVMSDQMATKLADAIRTPSPKATTVSPEKARLTPRERQIIGLLAQGESNKSIARLLDLSESTVKIHVQGILRKLQLNSRVQAAVYAVEHGLLPHAATD